MKCLKTQGKKFMFDVTVVKLVT